MHSCELIWAQHGNLKVTWADRDHCTQILSQASRSLIRILQTIEFLQDLRLLEIHFLLDSSWDELRTVICSLRPLICEEERGLIRKVSMVALDPTLFPVPVDLIMWELACGSLCVMQRILRGELDKNIL
jgi:hypothetical protein